MPDLDIADCINETCPWSGEPKDIGYCMLYLASDEARYLTGRTICVDGGSTLLPGVV